MKRLFILCLCTIFTIGLLPNYSFAFEGSDLMETGFTIYDGTECVDIIIDSAYPDGTVPQRNYTQISRAVGDLRQDIAMVTGAVSYYTVSTTFSDNQDMQAARLNNADKNKTPQLKNSGEGIIIGTIADSEIIKNLISEGKLDEAKTIEDKWEAFVIKQVDNSLVIAGSDARGTIYGIYYLSEAIGVSPWYWFSDSPVIVKDKIVVDFATAYIDDGPDVRYRGIFINDEERLIDWAKLKFPTNNGTPDVNLYRHLFELMLRLRANVLWPAMHEGTTAFNMAKDENGIPVNAKEAAKYGIIMASSHAEMMLRCNVSEWSEFKSNHWNEYTWNDNGSFDYTQNKEAILGYWRERLETNKDFESILSLGIRGVHDGDAEMDNLYLYNNSKVEMMRDVITEQRKLIKEIYGSETAVPQVFIPYKTVADIYNAGLKNYIPDDVMLMWAEDNYGNLRQTPTNAERSRSGGCGVYYHSSYWSWYSPKSYLWLNSTQAYYMAHQFKRAYNTGAQAYWTLNVGDLKPGDIVTELFLSMAWDMNVADNIDDFLVDHAMSEYGVDEETAETIASVMTEFYQLSGTKKAEFFGHVNGASYNDTYFSSDMIYPFSTVNEGDEGMRLVNKTNKMVDTLTRVYNNLPDAYKDVFYQQIYYHVLSYNDVAEEYVYLWKNQQAADEGRYQSAEIYEMLSKNARERVATRQEDFWAIKNGKWEKAINYNHPVSYYNMNEGVLLARDSQYKSASPSDGLGIKSEMSTLRFDSKAQNESYIDLFTKGVESESWHVTAPDWVVLSKREGTVNVEERLKVTVDFTKLSITTNGTINVYNESVLVAQIPVIATVNNVTLSKNSFVEANGKVVIEAEHYTEAINGTDGTYWAVFENAGRHGDAMSALPFDATRADDSAIKTSARLRYRVYFTSTGTFTGYFDRIPTLNEGTNDDGSSRSCRTAIGLDNATPTLLKGNSNTSGTWKSNIMHMIEPLSFSINVTTPGWHDIYIYRSDAGMIFDRIVIETISGCVPSSLLGPEESPSSFAFEAREAGTLPEELDKITVLSPVTLNEDETTTISLEGSFDSAVISDDRVASITLNNNTLTITALHSGTSAITLSEGDALFRMGVTVMPKTQKYVEENSSLVINASTAILNDENASFTASSNGIHSWALSGIGIMCTPASSSASKSNWLATNVSDGNKLLTASATEKVSSSASYGSAPHLTYNITITNPGTYKLYVNTSNPNAESDSYHVFVDNVWQYHSSEGTSQLDDSIWYTCSSSNEIYLTEGDHTLTIAARESGFTLNSIALFKKGIISTNDFSYLTTSPIKETGTIHFEFAPGVKSDGIVAITSSAITPSAWGDYPMTIRIRPEGHFDCYKGGVGFTYDKKITYKETNGYRVKVSVNVTNQTYSVDINGERMATDYPFRIAAEDISRVTIRGGADISPALFMAGSFTLTDVPESEDDEAFKGAVLIDENFSSSGNFGFSTGASVSNGQLVITQNMSNYTTSVKTFDAEIINQSAVEVDFDWKTNLSTSGKKSGLEFRDMYGRLIFAMASKAGTTLRYSITGSDSDSSGCEYALEPKWTEVSMDNSKTLHVHFIADFENKTISYEITQKDTGLTVASAYDASIRATSLAKFVACNYYTNENGTSYTATQNIDNFIVKGKEGDISLPYKGKTVYAFGDSIVAGHKYGKMGFVDFTALKMGMTVSYDGSYNGAKITNGNIIGQVNSAPSASPDVVIFTGGINDAYTSTDMTAFESAFNNLLSTMRSKWGNDVKIVYVAVHKTPARDSACQANTRSVAMKICEKYNVFVADVYSTGLDATIDDIRYTYIFDDLGSDNLPGTKETVSSSKFSSTYPTGTHPNFLGIEEFYLPTVYETLMASAYNFDASFSMANDNITVRAASDNEGFILALYEEDILSSVHTFNDETTVPFSSVITKAKVFNWANYESLSPYAPCKTLFTNGEWVYRSSVGQGKNAFFDIEAVNDTATYTFELCDNGSVDSGIMIGNSDYLNTSSSNYFASGSIVLLFSGGSLYTRDASSKTLIATYTPGERVNITIDADIADGLYTVYVNDELKAENVQFRTSADKLDTLSLVENGGGNAFEVYNFKVKS